MSDWLNLNFMVPMIAMIVIVVGILVICIAITRRRGDMRNGPKDVYCRLKCLTPTFEFVVANQQHYSMAEPIISQCSTLPLDCECICLRNLIEALTIDWSWDLLMRFERVISSMAFMKIYSIKWIKNMRSRLIFSVKWIMTSQNVLHQRKDVQLTRQYGFYRSQTATCYFWHRVSLTNLYFSPCQILFSLFQLTKKCDLLNEVNHVFNWKMC